MTLPIRLPRIEPYQKKKGRTPPNKPKPNFSCPYLGGLPEPIGQVPTTFGKPMLAGVIAHASRTSYRPCLAAPFAPPKNEATPPRVDV